MGVQIKVNVPIPSVKDFETQADYRKHIEEERRKKEEEARLWKEKYCIGDTDLSVDMFVCDVTKVKCPCISYDITDRNDDRITGTISIALIVEKANALGLTHYKAC